MRQAIESLDTTRPVFYDSPDLRHPLHKNEIEKCGYINLNIDLNLNGVAGVNTWGGRALPEYNIDGNLPYHYSFIIKAK